MGHQCGKFFSTSTALDKHIKRDHTKQQEDRFVCEFCPKTMNSAANLASHMRCHSDEKDKVCNLCDAKFKWSTSLSSHLRSRHSTFGTDHILSCKFCPRTFSDPTNHKAHQYTHLSDAEKPHKCPHCERGFIRQDMCQTHIKNNHKDQLELNRS